MQRIRLIVIEIEESYSTYIIASGYIATFGGLIQPLTIIPSGKEQRLHPPKVPHK